MALVSLGEKELLEITACSVDASGNVSVDENDKFSVMINPTSYKREQSICFSNERIIGEIGNRRRFSRVDQDNVSFEIIIDGTGVVNGDTEFSVEDRVADLSAILGYDGSEHEPKHSRLVWGTFLFYGRMTSMNIDYSLFKPSGEPLRATIKLNFVRFMTAEEESQEANRSSPDLSHIVEVKAGDTLPLLCHRVYKDSGYYTEVAAVNKLDNFRDLRAGIKLIFPPLK